MSPCHHLSMKLGSPFYINFISIVLLMPLGRKGGSEELTELCQIDSHWYLLAGFKQLLSMLDVECVKDGSTDLF